MNFAAAAGPLVVHRAEMDPKSALRLENKRLLQRLLPDVELVDQLPGDGMRRALEQLTEIAERIKAQGDAENATAYSTHYYDRHWKKLKRQHRLLGYFAEHRDLGAGGTAPQLYAKDPSLGRPPQLWPTGCTSQLAAYDFDRSLESKVEIRQSLRVPGTFGIFAKARLGVELYGEEALAKLSPDEFIHRVLPYRGVVMTNAVHSVIDAREFTCPNSIPVGKVQQAVVAQNPFLTTDFELLGFPTCPTALINSFDDSGKKRSQRQEALVKEGTNCVYDSLTAEQYATIGFVEDGGRMHVSDHLLHVRLTKTVEKDAELIIDYGEAFWKSIHKLKAGDHIPCDLCQITMRGSEIPAHGAKGPEIKGPREERWLIKFYERFIEQRNDVDDFQDWTMFECEHEAGCKNAIHKFHLPVAPDQWFCSAHSDVPLNTPPRRKNKKPRVESPQPASAAAAAGSSESAADAAPHVVSPTIDSPDVSFAAAESSESGAEAAPHVISPTLDSPDVSLAESDGAPVHEPDPADDGAQPMDMDAGSDAGGGAQNYDPDLVDLSSASSQPEEERVYAEISSDDEPAAAAAAPKASSSKKKKNRIYRGGRSGRKKDVSFDHTVTLKKAALAKKRREEAKAAAAAAEAREWWHREQGDGEAAAAEAEAAPATASASAAPLLSTGFAPAMTRELRNRDLSNAAAAAAPAAASASAAPLLSEEEIMARTNQYFLRIAMGEVPEAAATPPAAAAAAAAANPDEESAMLNAMLNLRIQPKRPLTLRNVFDD